METKDKRQEGSWKGGLEKVEKRQRESCLGTENKKYLSKTSYTSAVYAQLEIR